MTAQEIKSFTEQLLHFFAQNAGDHPDIHVPKILDGSDRTHEYTGMIGISGQRKGCLYFTATAAFLASLGRAMLPDQPLEELPLEDLVGEVANTIAGNAQKELGDSFHISIPITIRGHASDILMQKLKEPAYVIPMRWRGAQAALVIGIES